MDTIVFVDNDSKWIANYKRMLTPLRKELNCVYFHQPEEAMEFMSTHPTEVLVSELDMPVMSGRELFEMVDLLSPATVKVGITQVRDVADTLAILNQIKIHKLILKPFFVAEELIVPIRAAVEHYKENLKKEQVIKRVEEKLQELNQETEQLMGKMEEKKQGYDRILNAMLGMAEADLSLPVADFDVEKKEAVKAFCAELLREFFQYYMYEKKNLIFHLNYLKNKFHHPRSSCEFHIQNKVREEIPVTVMNRIAYVMFLAGFLCETCQEKYHIENILEAEADGYVLVLKYDWEPGTRGITRDLEAHKLMQRMIRELMRTLSDRIAEGAGEPDYVARLYFRKEGAGIESGH